MTMKANPMTKSISTPLATVLSIAFLAISGASATRAEEGEGINFGMVADPTVKSECSACHMAFPPGMLPAASWERIMGNLSDHFGEDASLDDATTRAVRDWLSAHAARPSRWMENAAEGGGAPIRITETAWWVAAHGEEVRPSRFDDPKIGSKANCAACHRGAEQGFFGDD